MQESIINIEELRDTHKKKRRIFIIFSICLFILGAVIFANAYLVRRSYLYQKNNFAETSMKIVAFNELGNNSANAICKYRYGEYEYAFTCYQLNKDEMNTKYKIGDTETIKVNPENPEEIMTKVDIEFYCNLIFVIDSILVIVGIIYSISCVRKSEIFIKRMEKEAKARI